MKINTEFLSTVIWRENATQNQTTNGSPSMNLNSTRKGKTTSFEHLYTESGFHNLKKWFLLNATNLDNNFTETQFCNFMRQLTDLNEFRMLEVFDFFGMEIITASSLLIFLQI